MGPGPSHSPSETVCAESPLPLDNWHRQIAWAPARTRLLRRPSLRGDASHGGQGSLRLNRVSSFKLRPSCHGPTGRVLPTRPAPVSASTIEPRSRIAGTGTEYDPPSNGCVREPRAPNREPCRISPFATCQPAPRPARTRCSVGLTNEAQRRRSDREPVRKALPRGRGHETAVGPSSCRRPDGRTVGGGGFEPP
jgi:hypothetical protein